MSKRIKKPRAVFELLSGGGSYRLNIYLVENAPEHQNAWADVQGKVVYDYQLNGVVTDLKKDGFKVEIRR